MFPTGRRKTKGFEGAGRGLGWGQCQGGSELSPAPSSGLDVSRGWGQGTWDPHSESLGGGAPIMGPLLPAVASTEPSCGDRDIGE